MIKAIMAVETGWGIGKDGTIPWPPNKEDFKQFREKTTGHIIVMGSKTWDDVNFPGPLKNRVNVVVSSNPDKYLNDGADVVISENIIEKIIELSKGKKDVWIIGGKQLLESCWEIVNELHLTIVPKSYSCDTFLAFPPDSFNIHSIEYSNETGNTFSIYKKKS